MRCKRGDAHDHCTGTVEDTYGNRSADAAVPVQRPAIGEHNKQNLASRDVEVIASQVSGLKRAEMRVAQRELAAKARFWRGKTATPLVTGVLQFSHCQLIACHVLPRLCA